MQSNFEQTFWVPIGTQQYTFEYQLLDMKKEISTNIYRKRKSQPTRASTDFNN